MKSYTEKELEEAIDKSINWTVQAISEYQKLDRELPLSLLKETIKEKIKNE